MKTRTTGAANSIQRAATFPKPSPIITKKGLTLINAKPG